MRMRLFFLLVALAGVVFGASQPAQAQSGGNTTHGVIRWGGYTNVYYANGRKQKVPVYSEAPPLFNDQVGWFAQRLGSATAQGQFTSLKYEAFSAADARLFDAAKLPVGPEPQLVTGIEAKQPVTFLRLRPVRRNPQTGQPEKLVAFDYQYVPGGVAAARGTSTTRDHVTTSVLASGTCFKIGVAESGIYKLDKTTLSAMGMSMQGLNPNNLHVYGNSMGILPQANATWRPDDLAENNILLVNNNGDGNFDDNEYFLFYSPGAHTWQAQGGVFQHRNNIYTDTTYYFVKVDGTAGKRVTTTAPVAATAATANLTTFTYRDFHEHDLANLLNSGRVWVGEGFRNGGQQTFSFNNIPDLVPASPVRVTASVVASASPNSSGSTFQLTLNSAPLGSINVDQLINVEYAAIAKMRNRTMSLATTGVNLQVGVAFTSSDPSASGYLDYLEINAERQLRLAGSQLEFRTLANIGAGATNRFTFSSPPAGMQVWDVTNPRQPKAQALVNGSFVANSDTVREYVALQPNGSFNTPRIFHRVPNQNLHAYNSNPNALLDLVIVTYPPFKAQAQRLADYRTTHDGLRTAVVTTTEVYNEYGSGGQDVTAIRDFMKQLYDHDNRPVSNRNLALLLFGDASFDYKSDSYNNKAVEQQTGWWSNRVPFKTDADFDNANQNFVPTYESRESFNPFSEGTPSYSSDDFYALLDDNEGEWVESSGNDLMDIGVGRLPVRTPKNNHTDATQAQQVVDKIIGYDASASLGKWRNRISLVADDGDGNLFTTRGVGSDSIAGIIQRVNPVYNIHKVYLDLHPQVSVAAGQRSPDASRAIDQSIEQGSLIVNYLGHGGPKGWANEQILTNSSVMALRNPNNLTFLMTGTCDFSTYDNPDFVSAGEQSLTDNVTGGAVGLFTTTRVVSAYENAGLNAAFYNRVLRPINGKMPSMGNILMLSKNDYLAGGPNNRNYTMLADPSMVLAYPKQTVILDSVRQRNATGTGWDTTSTLRALSRIRVHGRVLNNGVQNTTFTGRAQITIFDKPTTVRTLGNESGGDPSSPDAPVPIVIQESVIYGGQANVVNGEFNLTFVVPKDINYNTGMGKISLYAFDSGHVIDANGYQLKKVGGAATNAPKDTIPPIINLFMDSYSFAFGGLTAENTTLLANLSDDSGINTTGAGIGHDITAILDNDPNKLLVLNESYVSSVGDFRSGKVNNLFKELNTGPHSIRLKAWDTYNNSSEKEIEFMVARDEKLALDHVLNYPNPFANSTTFLFDHNQAGNVPGTLDVQVQIFTVAGHLVRTLNATVSSTESHQQSITWNGRDEYNDQLARGVYVYRLSVRSQQNNSVASKYEKLVILN